MIINDNFNLNYLHLPLMKGIYWISFFIVCLVAVCGCSQNSFQSTNVNTYESPTLGFRIIYPQEFVISSEPDYITITSPNDRNPLLVFVSTFESKDNLNTMTQEFKRLERQASDNFNLIDENVRQINGEQATVHMYTKTPSTPREKETYSENSVLQTTVIITIHENRGYRLVFTAAHTDADKWAIVQSMINSFEFRTMPRARNYYNSDLSIDEYEATFTMDGTLIEKYSYNIPKPFIYRMLYRNWGAPVSVENLDQPNIEYISIEKPSASIGYIKDYKGNVVLEDSDIDSVKEFININAKNNEIGVYKPDFFSQGIHSIEYKYKLHPPVEYDENLAHINIRLKGSEMQYKKVKISLQSKYVVAVFAYPSSINIDRGESDIILSGNVKENEPLGFELLLTLNAMKELKGYPKYEKNIKEKTQAAYNS